MSLKSNAMTVNAICKNNLHHQLYISRVLGGVANDTRRIAGKDSDLGDNGLGIMAAAVMSDALRAVVELHKPKTPTLPTIIEWDTKTFTNHFIYEDKCAIDGKSYPCPTIQAIDKELLANVDN